MEAIIKSPPVNGFIEVKFEQKIIDYLWKIIDIGKTSKNIINNRLAGNISQSLLLEDQDSYFYKPFAFL